MTIRSRLAGLIGGELRGNPLDNPQVPISQAAFMMDWGGTGTDAGVTVNEKTSMQLATVFTCVNVLQQDFSSLPVMVYEETDRGRTPAKNTPLYRLVAIEPNPEMGARTFYGMVIATMSLNGNAYAHIQRDQGRPVALWPLHPSLVKPKRVDNKLVYEVAVNGMVEVVQSADMLHFMNLTLDGMIGLSPITAAARTIGTAIAVEKFGARWFGRGSRPSGVLQRVAQAVSGQGTMQKEPVEKTDRFRESWERAYGGDNQGGTAVLPPGWEWKPIGVSPNEAQFLETQQLGRTIIAAIFRLQPHQAGDTSRLSNSNHESASLEYVKYTHRPLAAIIDGEMNRKLVPRTGAKANAYTIERDFTDLERGDFDSQMTGISVGRQWGLLTANEGRQIRGMNPVGPEGDILMVPLNMVPADKIDEIADQMAKPADPAAPDNEPEPAGNGGRNQRMLLQRMAQAFGPLFRDAAGRLAARDKRDAAAVQQIFGAVLTAIADEAGRQARDLHRLAADCDLGTERVVRDALKAIEKRAVDGDVVDELDRTVRTITLQIFREAGAQLAVAA